MKLAIHIGDDGEVYWCTNGNCEPICDNLVDCPDCTDGTTQEISAYCPTHSGAGYGHYWCSTHSINCGSSSSHTCCVHLRTAQHDD